MIEAYLYRIRIGNFNQLVKSRKFKKSKVKNCSINENFCMRLSTGMMLLMIVLLASSLLLNLPSSKIRGEKYFKWSASSACSVVLGKSETCNFKARYLHGNIRRGVVNMHINIRSLYNKMGEVKNLVKQEKPHILGISEAELKSSHHPLSILKLPGYDMLLPKSWSGYGKARVVVYIKKTLEYDHIADLEGEDVQSVWIRAGFKNCKKVYYSHQYREHTNTLGNTMAAQRTILDKMLMQWEAAVIHDVKDSSNEVHIAGDMNIDCLGDRWQDSNYSLVKLGRMVIQCCNSNNFSQMVDQVTRV